MISHEKLHCVIGREVYPLLWFNIIIQCEAFSTLSQVKSNQYRLTEYLTYKIYGGRVVNLLILLHCFCNSARLQVEFS
jgi:hypothetical protein